MLFSLAESRPSALVRQDNASPSAKQARLGLFSQRIVTSAVKRSRNPSCRIESSDFDIRTPLRAVGRYASRRKQEEYLLVVIWMANCSLWETARSRLVYLELAVAIALNMPKWA